jgi:hypothetical protein
MKGIMSTHGGDYVQIYNKRAMMALKSLTCI